MALLDDLQLSLMTFPQRWDGPSGALSLNVLVLPVGDPTAPLGTGPKFAGTTLKLTINVVSGLDDLPSTASPMAKSIAFTAKPPAVAPLLFERLYKQLVEKGIVVTSAKAQAPPDRARVKKFLPPSYTQAFAFEQPRNLPGQTDIMVGDSNAYECMLKAQAPAVNASLPGPDKKISWGQILSYALRQPLLARNLGLIYSATIPDAAALFAGGGYVWIGLDASSAANPWVADFNANAYTVKSYAARIPALDDKQKRPVFAATLFPVVAHPPSNLADAQREAEQYDDGFAQIVHARQPETVNAATATPGAMAAGAEAGVQLGWDDEQVTIWLNNQISLLRERANGVADPVTAEAPLGVQGYRIDVRPKGKDWTSLCVVSGTLPFDQNGVGREASTAIRRQEFWVAPVPVRPSTTDNSTNDTPALLPLYFAQWTGGSLVLPDPALELLRYAVNADHGPSLPPPTLPNPHADLGDVPVLLYGHSYEFRVRLVDLTGGGPLAGDPFVHEGLAPTTIVDFRRHVPPKSLEVAASPALPALRANMPKLRRIERLEVRRPRINYPEAVFARVDPDVFAPDHLRKLILKAWASGGAINVPDPDVDRFEVRVEARIPAHDTGEAGSNTGDLDGVFRVVYTTEVPFPDDEDDPTVTLKLRYTDIDDIAKMKPPSDPEMLPIPTARDVRVRLFPKCAKRTDYYGSEAVTTGLPADYLVRSEAMTESALFPTNPEMQLQGFYFQPGANVPQLLAQQLWLRQKDCTFSGLPGQRTVFAASGALRYSLAPDAGSITFSNQTELLGHWIVALLLDLKRDWTWDGLFPLQPVVTIQRGGTIVGTIPLPRAVPAEAAGAPGQPPDRNFTRIVFFDAVNPQPEPGKFPRELQLNYTFSANFPAAPTQITTYPLTLPITTTPAQTPKIASAGIAESPFQASPKYSETSLRDRYLWIEFDRAIDDAENDSYFGRVLAYGPDPLLAGSLYPTLDAAQMQPESVETGLSIDPEPVRRIFSGQSSDESGLDAMTQLVPADKVGVGTSGAFYLLPLPPGITAEDLELFGFWTYEFRVGHAKYWSTAQGRFGRPLRAAGIQHPAPHLICSVERTTAFLAGHPPEVRVAAPYAVTVFNGNRLYDFRRGDPQTVIWFMLYAQVMQADGAVYRNILLDRAMGTPAKSSNGNGAAPHSASRNPRAHASFSLRRIRDRLAELGLPEGSPLSVLAVEVLPGKRHRVPIEVAGDVAHSEKQEDPLGADLGERRILRTSPLTAVPAAC